MLIKGGRLLNPSTNLDEYLDIIIEDGKIKEIGRDLSYSGDIIDAKGLIVAPGLVDIHVHFREPGFTHKEDINSGSKSAAAGGYTCVVAMANTKPVIDNPQVLKDVLDIMKKQEIDVYSAASITKGFDGNTLNDLATLKEAGAVVFTDDGIPINNMDLIIKAMEKAKELDMVLSFHEEDPYFIKTPGYNEGDVALRFGIEGSPNVSEDIMVSRDIMLALRTGAKIDIQHISSKNSVELVRLGKKLGAKVYAEATPHHFSLTEEDVLKYKTFAKMNPPLRKEEDRQAIIEGLKDGTIDFIATDHAPHTNEEKSVEMTKAPSGIIGLETALSLAITNLVRPGHLTLMEVLRTLTINPARALKLDAGEIEVGKKANLVIFNENEEIVYKKYHSKSENTPFTGMNLFGKVKYTIAKGEIVYKA